MKIAVILLLLPLCASAEECFDIDRSRSEVNFGIEQAGATFSGAVEMFGGAVCTDGDAISRIDAWLEPASIRTGLPELDAELAGEAFFSVKQHPRATFISTDIEKTGEEYIAHGTLDMKGVRKPFDLPFALKKMPEGYRAAGETSLERLEFNIGTGEWSDTQWLGNTVTVTFTVEAT